MRHEADTIIVGGGLAGLTAAVCAARAGRRVAVYESGGLGGRAATLDRGAFLFNEGPHALYQAGAAREILSGLGIPFTGGDPATQHARAVVAGKLHELPRSAATIMTSGALSLRGRIEAARFFELLGRLDPAELDHIPLKEWIDREIRSLEVRNLARMLFRLATYSDTPEIESAGAQLAQVRLGFAGVLYLDGGWGSLVEGLRRAAAQAGAVIFEEERVKAVHGVGQRYEVITAAGEAVAASVVLAVRPAVAAALAPASAALARWAAEAVPARAACLDLGLRRLPCPGVQFALGTDKPLYMSVHTRSARLAPGDGAVVQVARYLGTEPPANPPAVERELEWLMDLTQPGWRAEVAERRYLPNMVVTNWVPLAASGGRAGRPGPAVPDSPGLFIAGDWVGDRGMLADGAVASGCEAARLAVDTRAREYAVA